VGEIAARLAPGLPAAPFLPRYTTKYLADKDANFGALKHYLDALEIRTQAHKMGALFAGKMPHAASLVAGRGHGESHQPEHFAIPHAAGADSEFHQRILFAGRHRGGGRVPGIFFACARLRQFSGLWRISGNRGRREIISGGAKVKGRWQKPDPEAVTEDIGQSRFSSGSGLKPFDGETVAAPDKNGAYSWLKAPRYQGEPMEVGPLARVLAAYQNGDAEIKKRRGQSAQDPWSRCRRAVSVMGRHAARALECKILADRCSVWLDQLTPDARFQGFFHSRIRPWLRTDRGGAAARWANWIDIKNKKIANYQCVVPTTWNCSPRDDRGVPGPVEQALVGLPIADAKIRLKPRASCARSIRVWRARCINQPAYEQNHPSFIFCRSARA